MAQLARVLPRHGRDRAFKSHRAQIFLAGMVKWHTQLFQKQPELFSMRVQVPLPAPKFLIDGVAKPGKAKVCKTFKRLTRVLVGSNPTTVSKLGEGHGVGSSIG